MSKKPKMTQREGYKWKLFTDIHSGLTADGYCLVVVRADEEKGKLILNLGKEPHQKKNVDDDFLYLPDTAAEMSPDLQRFNLQDYNIFTTLYSSIYHYLLVDDVTLENRDAILRDYFPCVVTETSFNKFQVVLKVRKSECLGFSLRKIIDRLSEDYGRGKNTDGAIRRVWLPGYGNRDRKCYMGGKPFFTNLRLYKDQISERAEAEIRGESFVPVTNLEPTMIAEPAPPKLRRKMPVHRAKVITDWTEAWQEIFEFTRAKYGDGFDCSIVDFRTVKLLRRNGVSEDDLLAQLENASDVRERHPDIANFVKKAVAAAV